MDNSQKKENIIQSKSLEFAMRIVKLSKFLQWEKEFILSSQILRSGTSIGANIEEAQGWISRKEFIHKVNIAYKESRETLYWLKLLVTWEYISQDQYASLFADCEEIIKILTKILVTSRQKE